MTKERPSQLELFSGEKDSEQLSIKPVDPGLLDYIKLYEKALLIIIGFVITGIAAFCCGVEKGKTISVAATRTRFDAAERLNQPLQPIVASIREIPVAPTKLQNPDSGVSFSIPGRLKNMPVKQEIILEQPAQSRKNAYTVQIASYQARGSAEKEMEKLKQKGFSPLVIRRGGYNVVCVGSFNNKETAISLLSQLKSKYRDCYIRRL